MFTFLSSHILSLFSHRDKSHHTLRCFNLQSWSFQTFWLRYPTKVPLGHPTTTTSLFKSVSVQTASQRGLWPCSLFLCPSWEKSPLCCLDSGRNVWKSSVCGESREEVRLRQRASSEPSRTAAAWGTSVVWRGRSSGLQQGGRGPEYYSCSPPETGSSGWIERMRSGQASPPVSQ